MYSILHYIMNKFCCTICNIIYSPIYMNQRKKTLLHLENAYKYYIQERIEGKFGDYFVNITII